MIFPLCHTGDVEGGVLPLDAVASSIFGSFHLEATILSSALQFSRYRKSYQDVYPR